MIRIVSILYFLMSFQIAQGQLTFSISNLYLEHNRNYYQLDPWYRPKLNLEYEVSYLQRFKYKRLDFRPGLSFNSRKNDVYLLILEPFIFGQMQEKLISLTFQVRTFPFSFNQANDLGSIRKAEGFLKKSFYVFYSGAFTFLNQYYDIPRSLGSTDIIHKNFWSEEFRKGFGLGLEFGLSSHITASVFLARQGYKTYNKDFIDNFNASCPICSSGFYQEIDKSNAREQAHLGISIMVELAK